MASHSTTTPVLLLFGSGRNTGLATARKFASEGYKVAAVSRHPCDELKDVASVIVPADLTDPRQVGAVFEKVTAELGTPHVVVYNAYDGNAVPWQDPLQVPAQRMAESLAVNVVSPHEAARLAVQGFARLPAGTGAGAAAAKTFLFTGNPFHRQLQPAHLALGVGKAGTAYWVEAAAKTAAYTARGFKFYYVDERTPEGGATNLAVDGAAHAAEFWRLSHEVEGQGPWDWTFVKGAPGGYVPFAAQVEREVVAGELPFALPEGGMSLTELMNKLADGGHQL